MSSTRYDWWGYAKAMIRRYPDKCLPNEKEAVEAAIEVTKQLKTGEERLKLIDMVFWEQSHSLRSAALNLYISERTAQRWHSDFIREVGRNFRCSSLTPDPACYDLPPKPKQVARGLQLTEKQRQCIALMADLGMSKWNVAMKMGTSKGRVYGHIYKIKEETGLDCGNFWDLIQLNEMIRGTQELQCNPESAVHSIK